MAGGVGGTEAVVDIYDGDTGSATGEHAQEGAQAGEVGAVADAGGNGDDGAGNETCHDAGQGAFHTRNDDQDVSGEKLINVRKEPVQASDADVVNPQDGVSHEIGGDSGFFSDGQVAGAGANDGDGAGAFWERFIFEG